MKKAWYTIIAFGIVLVAAMIGLTVTAIVLGRDGRDIAISAVFMGVCALFLLGFGGAGLAIDRYWDEQSGGQQ